MSVPFDASMILRLLRAMPTPQLATVQPHKFQTWPCQVVLPANDIGRLIANERSNRGISR